MVNGLLHPLEKLLQLFWLSEAHSVPSLLTRKDKKVARGLQGKQDDPKNSAVTSVETSEGMGISVWQRL